jgi:hypothetical protein
MTKQKVLHPRVYARVKLSMHEARRVGGTMIIHNFPVMGLTCVWFL